MKIRRGGYVFISWIGDHSPKHVHVYKNKRMICKWNLEDEIEMKGKASARLKRLIKKLKDEKKL